MSEEMAVTDKASEDETNLNGGGASSASASSAADTSSVLSSQKLQEPGDETTPQPTDAADTAEDTEESRGRKRRASSAFSDDDNNFKGFDASNLDDSAMEYSRMLERIEAEVVAESKKLVPVRDVVVTPTTATIRVSKRLRQDTGTDGSRPSSALSSRSDGDGITSSTDMASSAASSPAHRRRPAPDISSPKLRVPLERGWRRELVYRATLDQHSRRNADIYYYMPGGRKLRSTREIADNLSGTGLTLENFSFFKEPLGIDDPEKEIIRDAKPIRKGDSPAVSVPPAQPLLVESKRTPKPKPPKGASPDPPAVIKSPPAKIKVKSVGSRLSNNATTAATAAATTPKQPPKKQVVAATTTTNTTADNNNSTAWKKPRIAASLPTSLPPSSPPPPPPPALAETPSAVLQSPPAAGVQQPCSISCGGGAVPSLACAACLCLYHPPCVGYPGLTAARFLCKNCKRSSSPEPLPAAPHKPVTSSRARGGRRSTTSAAARQPPIPKLTVKMSEINRRAGLAAMPQSRAVLNGRRFIVVPRNIVMPPGQHSEAKGKTQRISNGAPTPPRRRGRTKPDDTDYFTQFYTKNKTNNDIVVSQIFQYLGMRDLGRCARVCRLWRQLAAAPALWRHVRMKNSHVSDWSGLCAALKRHGTTRLDLRKMLLPQNDDAFWDSFGEHISTVVTLERIEMCRCPARAVEAVCRGVPNLRSLCALAVRDARLDPAPLASLPRLTELRLKSMSGLSLTRDLSVLASLTQLQHLSLTSIKELGLCSCEIVGSLTQLVSLELGECTFGARFGAVLRGLTRLRRLRLERGTADCAAPQLLAALATLPQLAQLELVNFDVKVGFDDALAECKNIQRLLIIPTYVSQSATTNKQVLSGVLRLKDTLTHLMWGVTIELLRVTELFIDQCDQGGGGENKKKDIGECIPVLKPVPGCKLPDQHPHVQGPPQVEILPLPTLQRLLAAQLPNTKLKLLRIPFHATWRQSLADFQ